MMVSHHCQCVSATLVTLIVTLLVVGQFPSAFATEARQSYNYSPRDDKSLRVGDVGVASLTTEYLKDPMGVDKAIPRVSWKLVVKPNRDRPSFLQQKAYQLHVKVTQAPSILNLNSTMDCCSWKDCGWVFSNQTHLVPFECQGVTPLTVDDTDITWKVSVQMEESGRHDEFHRRDILDQNIIHSDVAHFRTALFHEWQAKWITGGTLLRKEFSLPKYPSEYATLFVSGIGYHHVYLDSIKVGDHQLDPGWTDFNKRVWYSTYDITHMLHNRHNSQSSSIHVISVMLGNGWWSCGPPPGSNQPYCSKDPPQLILQLHVDGQPVLVTDENWIVSDDSPIVYNSLYNGEIYDARVAERIKGWQLPGYDTISWTPAELATSNATKAKLASQLFEPIRHITTKTPISISVAERKYPTNTGIHNITQVLDFGQNQAAVVRLKRIFCTRGTEVTLRHAEVLMHPPYGDYDGTTIYVDNLRTAKATDHYICSGNPAGESYIPYFTQHGFRYVEIHGLNYTLDPTDVEAVEIHSDVQSTSSIYFADPLLNKIQHLVIWGLKSNLMSVQTDCNQRDERLGWMGDAALTAEAAAMNFGMGAFYTHWLDQMMDAQNTADGAMPNFVPPLNSRDGAPNWQTAYVMILWVMASQYGDQEILVQHHESLVKYFDFLEKSYRETGIANFREQFGDWCPPDPHPKAYEHLTGAFAFLGDMKLGMELFRYSPHPNAQYQLNRLKGLSAKATPEFHNAFYNQTSAVYMSGLQTEQALPLYLGVIPKELQGTVLSHLVRDIEVINGGHTTSGIVGIKYCMEALSMFGRGDVALDLALQISYPSWGYMVQSRYEPATTVWELWNGDTKGPGMNSRNHHMFGSISGWFYKYVAGITPLEPGYRRIQIKPNVLRMDSLATKVATPHGDVELIYFKQKLDTFKYEITLPPGTSGTFIVPVALNDRPHDSVKEAYVMELMISERGEAVWAGMFIPGVPGVLGVKSDGKHVHLDLTNGSFQFHVRVVPNVNMKIK